MVDAEKPSLGALFRTSTGTLALALLTVELVAGIQTYVTSTILPLMASDLHAQQEYGLVSGAGQVAMVLTMPLGTFLLTRYPAARLLTWFTLLTIAGAVVSAAAPNIELFITGRVAVGLASGALATISMGVIVIHLPGTWRRFVLAGYAAVWVVISLVGPIYASWISLLLGWRWAMVLYLPLLVAARILIARKLPDNTPDGDRSPLDILSAIVLASGIALFSALASVGPWWPILGLGGAILTAIAGHRLLPKGTFTWRRGRPSAVALLGILCGIYFGAGSIITIVAHDILGFGPAVIGLLLMAGGLSWAVTGILCGKWPPAVEAGFRRRIRLGSLLLLGGLLLTATAALLASGFLGNTLFVAGWAIASVGMGLCYLDTLNRIVETPATPDGIPVAQAAAASVLVEVLATAILTAAATAAASMLLIASGPAGAAVILAALSAGTIPMLLLIGRVIRHPAGTAP
jgi:MFS family permease